MKTLLPFALIFISAFSLNAQFSAGASLDRIFASSSDITYTGVFVEYRIKSFLVSGRFEINPGENDRSLDYITNTNTGGGSSPHFQSTTTYTQQAKYLDGNIKLSAGPTVVRYGKRNPSNFRLFSIALQYQGLFVSGYKFGDGTQRIYKGNNSNQQHQFVVTQDKTTPIDYSIATTRYVSCSGLNTNFRLGNNKAFINLAVSSGIVPRSRITLNEKYFAPSSESYYGTEYSGKLYKESTIGRTFYLSAALSVGYTFGKAKK